MPAHHDPRQTSSHDAYVTPVARTAHVAHTAHHPSSAIGAAYRQQSIHMPPAPLPVALPAENVTIVQAEPLREAEFLNQVRGVTQVETFIQPSPPALVGESTPEPAPEPEPEPESEPAPEPEPADAPDDDVPPDEDADL